MSRTSLAALAVLFLSACSDTPYTWGDLSFLLTDAACTEMATCGTGFDTPACIAAGTAAACEPSSSCDVAINQGQADAALSTCQAALDTLDDAGCQALRAGTWPTGCDAARALRPVSP